MVTRNRANIPARSSDDAKRPESEADVETTCGMNVDADVEHVDSNATHVIDSHEDSERSANRVDIESGSETDVGMWNGGAGLSVLAHSHLSIHSKGNAVNT